MAVNANRYPQALMDSGMKPSRFEGELLFWINPDMKRVLSAVHAQGGQVASRFIAPWDGVIEGVQVVQEIAGAGAVGQNSLTLSVAGVSCFALATDGNTLLDAAPAGSTALTFPTSVAAGALIANNDGVSRVRFLKGDVIALGSVAGGAQLGTVRIEIEIAREFPASAV